MAREKELPGISGWAVLLTLLALMALIVYGFVLGVREPDGFQITWTAILAGLDFFLLLGLFVVNPNEGKALQLFGAYTCTVKTPGLRWANPLLTKRRISLRIRNFEMLSRREIVKLDDERRAAMVSNLLVVLCGERATQPIINTGTIYQ